MHALTLDAMLHQELPAARRGDTAAYGRIVSGCQNTVTAIALAITRDVAASEDIAQDAFLRAWQRLDRLKNHDSFLPWLRQITRNLARDHLRARRHAAMTGEDAELAIAIAADPAPQPAERLLITEQETVAADIIAALPEDSREALLLYYREGQSSQQVALLLGLSDAAVRKRLSRARETVRGELLARFGEFARGSAPSAGFAAALVGVLGVAAKPAAAAGLEVAVAGSIGGGFLAKTAVGSLIAGAGSLIFGLISAGIMALLTRGILFRFTQSADERKRVSASYKRYIVVSLGCIAAFAATARFTTSAWPLIMAIFIGIGLLTYETLVPLRRVMIPLLERDTARDPINARKRQRMYYLMFGKAATLVTDVALLLVVAPFILQRL
ncbi:sigma-70 family RNA polymerase sigma factor [Pseudoxanthomonas sp.]|uniref:RNA polymerase sigma factor n=1 Tax=Pseudoxanthomonas sp. TaxID=1871049 RepID=UPI0026035849|nr:sigma-70 family RNA polymerase sigma factor [Pseudoxanthomonas sp.]WDS36290.1 MAG: sigma-70 family RNA polymerase sigma factor [Pseudoxanthomonas sp.]